MVSLLWLGVPVLGLVAVDKLSYAFPKKRGYRAFKARVLNKLFRNDLGHSFPAKELRESLAERAHVDTDISDHLSELFYEVVNAEPRLIVELGTRGGESTRALLAAAQVLDAQVLSVDIAECSGIDLPSQYAARWTFVKSDDVSFGQGPFQAWCKQRGYAEQADFIFLDTSHLYDHTVAELAVWMPLLKPGGTIVFHDTNMRPWAYRRLDNSQGVGAWNERGVIRALEEYLGRKYDENSVFTDVTDTYLIKHRPNCNGFTVIKRRR